MKISEDFAELIGALMGDGYIYRKNGKYQIGFVGNIVNDKGYFEYLKRLILKEWNKDAKIKVRAGGLRMVIDSKEICRILIDELNLPHGEGKCERVFIPDFILKEWDLTSKMIRGLIDTDGSVFVAKKPGIEKYPSIEFTTTSKILAEQMKKILVDKDFRVAKIWQVTSKLAKRKCYRVPLNGRENLRKWLELIGFSNPWKLERAKSYLK